MITPALSDFIDIHTHSPRDNCYYLQNIFAQALDSVIPGEVPCSIGLHPWHIQQLDIAGCMHKIEIYASLPQVLAIGETGLDRNIETPLEIQERVFMQHIRISETIKKPMVIHCVKAYSDLMHIRKDKEWKIPWMFHWFNENLAIANELINMNCYLSFGRSLLHPNGRNAEVFRTVPLEHVFLETDDAEITIENVYARAAELKSTSIEELKQAIHRNFYKVFMEG